MSIQHNNNDQEDTVISSQLSFLQNSNNLSSQIFNSSLNTNETFSNSTFLDNATFTQYNTFVQDWNLYNPNFWKIVTLNVRGINEEFKFHDIILWLDKHNVDIACLTETKISEQTAIHRMKSHPKWISSWTINEEHTKGSGIGLLFKKSLGSHVFSWNKTPGRAIIATLKFSGKINISVVGIYGPASYADKKSTKKAILSNCLQSIKSNHHIIALGDFNEDEKVAHHEKSLLKFFQGKNCTDLNNEQYNSGSTITWKSSTCSRTIDHIFTSQEFLRISASAHTIGINHVTNSDHRGIAAKIFIKHLISRPKPSIQMKNREKIVNLKKCTKAHWEQFFKYLEKHFQISNSNDIDQIWINLKDQIKTAMEKILPWKKVGAPFNFSKQESISHLAALHSNRILKIVKSLNDSQLLEKKQNTANSILQSSIHIPGLSFLKEKFPQAGWNKVAENWTTTNTSELIHVVIDARKRTKEQCKKQQAKEDQKQIKFFIDQ